MIGEYVLGNYIILNTYHIIIFMKLRADKEFPTATTGPRHVRGGEEKPFDWETKKKYEKKVGNRTADKKSTGASHSLHGGGGGVTEKSEKENRVKERKK